MKKVQWIAIGALVCATVFALISCGGGRDQDDPREVVIALFGAMEKNDKAALAHLLDLVALMQAGPEDYSLGGGEPRRWTNPQQILDDLTDQGLTKTRWFAYQRIVNEAQVSGETATVEVTFVDKEQSRGYRTKFGVHVIHDKWKIFSFKMVQGES